jgi:uncharacterized lipoprotein YddW (UPF0748 family)
MDSHALIRVCRAHTLLGLAVCVLIGALTAQFAVPLGAAAGDDEVRALWVRRTSLDSPDAIRKMVASAATAGFNTLFVQVAADPGERPQPGFDAIGETLAQAHAAGLRVHAWVDVALAAASDGLPSARDHVIYQHPEWLMVPRAIAAELLASDSHNPDYVGRLARWTRANSTRVDGLYISPVQPAAAAHVAEAVRELVSRYALDGVYLDHVEYPGDDFDYSRRSIEVFGDFMRSQLLPAERDRIAAIEAIDSFAYPDQFPDQWRLFRQSQLTALVARLRSTVKAARPSAVVSAAVTADAAIAEHDKLQDWRTWLDGGFLDALCPVVSGVNAAQFAALLAEVHAIAGTRPVWAGIGANRLSQRETLDDIVRARRAGAHGIILFSYDSLITPPKGTEYLSAIGRGAFDGS